MNEAQEASDDDSFGDFGTVKEVPETETNNDPISEPQPAESTTNNAKAESDDEGFGDFGTQEQVP